MVSRIQNVNNSTGQRVPLPQQINYKWGERDGGRNLSIKRHRRELVQCVDFLWILIQMHCKFKNYQDTYEIIGNLSTHWIYDGIKKLLLVNKRITGTGFSLNFKT